MDKTTFMNALLERATAAGFQAAECYLTTGDSFEAGAHQNEITTYDVSSSVGLGFRGLIGGRMGYAATQALDEAAIDQLIAGARTNAQLIDNEDAQFLFDGKADYPVKRAFEPALEDVSAADKLQKLLALEKAARTLDPRVTHVEDSALFTSRARLEIKNTLGLDVSFEENGAGMYIAPLARTDGDVNTALRFRFSRDFDALNPEALAREAVEAATRGLNAAPVKSGEYLVALDREAASDLLSTFMSPFSADAAQKGLSLLSGREGEALAAQILTLVDDPLYAGAYAGAPFDGEGVPARRKAIIERGVLVTLMHNLKTAHKQNVPTTGNAARASYASQVSIAPSNFFVEPGPLSRAKLLAGIDRGLIITELMGLHAGANAVSGDFSLGAKGFAIENGQIAQPVGGITVAGNFFDLIKNVRAVADDLWFAFPGRTSVGSPTIDVGPLKVAGV